MVQLGRSVAPKPPKSEPQGLRLIKYTKNTYVLGNRLEWYGKGTSTNKQYKIGQRNAY